MKWYGCRVSSVCLSLAPTHTRSYARSHAHTLNCDKIQWNTPLTCLLLCYVWDDIFIKYNNYSVIDIYGPKRVLYTSRVSKYEHLRLFAKWSPKNNCLYLFYWNALSDPFNHSLSLGRLFPVLKHHGMLLPILKSLINWTISRNL